MRVALVRTNPGESGYASAYGYIAPPLGLASLAGAVRDIAEVKIIDAEAKNLSEEETLKEIEAFNPDVVGFTTIASTYVNPSLRIVRKMRERGVESLVVFGGHHATFTYPLVLRERVDVVVVGEGESTFRELVVALKEGRDVSNVRGIAYRDGEKVNVSYRGPILNLDNLPMPAYDLLDPNAYKATIVGENARIASIETSRGCPYNCEFCSASAMWGHAWRFKSNERVVEELKFVKSLGYNWVFFVDDNFVVPYKYEERIKLLDSIIEEGLNDINYIIQIRADIIAKHPELAEKLAEAGVKVAFMGIESGSEEVLKAMRKGLRKNDTFRAIQLLSEQGIVTYGGVIIGAPYESREDRKATYKFVQMLGDHGLDAVQISIYTPLPGSDSFYRALKDRLILTFDWDLYDVLHPVMRTKEKLWRLYFESREKTYMFYFKKWLHGIRGKSEKYSKPILSTGKRYVIRRLPHYIKNFLKLPVESFLVQRKILNSAKKLDEYTIKILEEVYTKHLSTYLKIFHEAINQNRTQKLENKSSKPII
ncbi:B12-binding domain-containing radical SAM protein [Thermococcus aggregans]|uniref:B12-binding domain-containing radical SAM protein n=1 Tax=Thermococcus aggregans TaxID=110163 RepID=A0A9E7MYD0_THEAG|nr:radical SAM protein [Thermococcus aggregans]USS41204.1 B12-binding domain-containing radical SAM protein [Thermococcus aggregans]